MVLIRKKDVRSLTIPFQEFVFYIFEPKCTIALVLLNCALFVMSAFMPETVFESSLLHPTDIMHLSRWYTLVTNTFFHANLAHLGGNMLLLYAVGRTVEKRMGSSKTLLIYSVALVGASITAALYYLITNPNTSVLGASGAIMGMASAAMLLDPFYIVYEFIVPLPVFVISWIAIFADFTSIFNGQQDGIAHLAHIGGFASILIVYALVQEVDKRALKKGLFWNVALLASAAIIFYVLNRYRLI